VYVSGKYPLGISAEEYARLPERERKLGFTMMKRDAAVYVRGEVLHPDHETITLDGWHRVLMNTRIARAHCAIWRFSINRGACIPG
jgi:hypothetical protein